jgi:hypothetical protein
LVQEITSEQKPSILPEDPAGWTQDLEARLDGVQQHPEQGLGFIEEHVRQCTDGTLRDAAIKEWRMAVEKRPDAAWNHEPVFAGSID